MKNVAEINYQPDGHVLITRRPKTKPKVYFPTQPSLGRLDQIIIKCLHLVNGIYVYRV